MTALFLTFAFCLLPNCAIAQDAVTSDEGVSASGRSDAGSQDEPKDGAVDGQKEEPESFKPATDLPPEIQEADTATPLPMEPSDGNEGEEKQAAVAQPVRHAGDANPLSHDAVGNSTTTGRSASDGVGRSVASAGTSDARSGSVPPSGQNSPLLYLLSCALILSLLVNVYLARRVSQ